MTSSDEGKNLTGLARSIDALFAAREDVEAGPVGVEETSALEDEAEEAAAPQEEEAAEATAQPEDEAAEAAAPQEDEVAEAAAPQEDEVAEAATPQEEEAAEAAAPQEGTPPDEPAEDLVWEQESTAKGPGRRPRPDPDAFRQAVDVFVSTDPLDREGQGREIREMAAALRDAGALDPLADGVEQLALQEEDPGSEACLAMARSLVNPAVASRLVARMSTERDEPRRAALIQVCRRIGAEMALALADALSSEVSDRLARRTYVEAMVALGEVGMNVVEKMMEDGRWFVVRNGVAILGEVGGDRAVELITTSLAHPDPRVRKEALLALARVGGEDAGLLIYGMIEDTDPEVRTAAAMAAGELKVERALRPLLSLLDSERDEDVIVGVLRALGQLGDPGAVPAIEKRAVRSLFSHPPINVRLAAYRALHRIGTPHARSLLTSAASDKEAAVRSAVRQILEGGE